MSTRPYWELGEDRPSWYLGDLRPEPRIKQTRAPIYRTVSASPALIERAVAEGAPILNIKFALFDRWQEIDSPDEGRFLERIARTAFTKSIKERFRDIKALLSHGRDPSLGSILLGEIQSIKEETDAAVARVALFPSVPALLMDGLRSGLYQASFRGDPVKTHVEYRPGKSAHNPRALPEVVRQEIRLKDIGPCAFGAYAGTSAVIGEG